MNSLPGVSRFPRSAQLPGGLDGRVRGAPGPLSSLPPSGLGDVPTTYVNGRSTETPTNSRVVQAVRVVADGSAGTLHDLDNNLSPGSLHFGTVSDTAAAKYRSPGGRALAHDAPRNVKSVEALNFWLRSVPGRVKYGGDRDAEQLANEYTCEGVLQTYTEPQTAVNRAERVVSMAPIKRVRMPDLCAAEGTVAPASGCKIYAVWMRHTLEEGTTELQDLKDDQKPAFDSFRDLGVRNQQVPNTYWQIHLIRMPRGSGPPSAMLYITKDWIGTYRYVGKITDVFYKAHQNDPSQQRLHARKALFPEFEDAECHRKSIVQLHELEVFLCVK